MDWKDLQDAAKLTDEELQKARAWCGDNIANLAHIEPLDVDTLPDRLLVRRIRAQLGGSPSAAPPEVTVRLEPPPQTPDQMSALQLLDLMETESGRLEELVPYFFRTAAHGLVVDDAREILFGETRSLEERGGPGVVIREWNGHRVIAALREWQQRADWYDPLSPGREQLLPDGRNPIRGWSYAGLDLDTVIPMLELLRASRDLEQLDADEVLRRLREPDNPWTQRHRRRWSRLPEVERLLCVQRARRPSSGPHALASTSFCTPAIQTPEQFLVAYFGVEEMCRLVRHWIPGLFHELPPGSIPAQLAHEIAWGCKRRGATPRLLLALKVARPARAGELGPFTRDQLYRLLIGLSPGDFGHLKSLGLPSDARRVTLGIQGHSGQIRALLDHYDVPDRGLDALALCVARL